MLLQAEAEMFPALLEVFTPPLPTHITLFFLGINVRNGQQNTRLLHAAEIGVDYRIEHPHRRREIHIGIDQRRNVLVELADALDQDAVILLIGLAREKMLVIGIVQVELHGIFTCHQMIGIGKVTAQEPDQGIACHSLVRSVHRHLAEKVFHLGIQHHKRPQTVPEVVQRIDTLRIAARLIGRLYERTPQFDGIGQVFLAEFVAEGEIMFSGRCRGFSDVQTIKR